MGRAASFISSEPHRGGGEHAFKMLLDEWKRANHRGTKFSHTEKLQRVLSQKENVFQPLWPLRLGFCLKTNSAKYEKLQHGKGVHHMSHLFGLFFLEFFLVDLCSGSKFLTCMIL